MSRDRKSNCFKKIQVEFPSLKFIKHFITSATRNRGTLTAKCIVLSAFSAIYDTYLNIIGGPRVVCALAKS